MLMEAGTTNKFAKKFAERILDFEAEATEVGAKPKSKTLEIEGIKTDPKTKPAFTDFEGALISKPHAPNQDNNFEQELDTAFENSEVWPHIAKILKFKILSAHLSSLEEAVRLAYEKGRKEKINYRGMTLEQKREYWKLNKRRLRATLTKDQEKP